jgi:hypothetical protein
MTSAAGGQTAPRAPAWGGGSVSTSVCFRCGFGVVSVPRFSRLPNGLAAFRPEWAEPRSVTANGDKPSQDSPRNNLASRPRSA